MSTQQLQAMLISLQQEGVTTAVGGGVTAAVGGDGYS